MIVLKTSVFPSSKEVIFQKLQRFETLRFIAKPYAAFDPVDSTQPVRTAGSTSSCQFRLLGLIPFSTHTIRIIRGANEHVPVWYHDIILTRFHNNYTKYIDQIEIKAGWKTVFIRLWANAFYAHRQRKWVRMPEAEK